MENLTRQIGRSFGTDQFVVKGLYRNGIAAFTTFPKAEVLKIKWYCQSLGYHAIEDDPEEAQFIKVTSLENPKRFGYICALLENKDDSMSFAPMYGFKSNGHFFGKYNIKRNIDDHLALEYIYSREAEDQYTEAQLVEFDIWRRIPDLENESMRELIHKVRHGEEITV